VEGVADRLRVLRPSLDVAVGLLEHGPPHVRDVATAGDIAVPLLLSSGYHVRADLPEQAPATRVAAAVGPDPALADALADRLREAGYDGGPVTLAAAGSADPRSLADVAAQATMLADLLGVTVDVGYVAAGEPRLAELRPASVASYLLAPGTFADAAAACGAAVVSAPLGAHPALAEIALRRYDEALTAP
jgi:sirohydrochlorin ferrochelatase